MLSDLRGFMIGRRLTAVALTAALLITACGSGDDARPSTGTDGAGNTDADGGGSTETNAPADTGAAPETTPSTDAPDTGERDQTLRFGLAYAPSGNILDAHMMPRVVDYQLAFLIYGRLLSIGPDGGIAAGLAEAWELSEDGRTIDLTLRPGLLFHDGTVLDGAAVKANIERGKGEGMATALPLSTVESVDAVDDLSVTLNLSEPGPALLATLTGFAGMMISPDAFDNDDLAVAPVGSGPFRLTASDADGYSFERFEDYWDVENTQLRAIEMTLLTDAAARYNALASGQVDLAAITPDRLGDSEAAGLGLVSAATRSPYALMLDASKDGLNNAEVRKALNHAVDRDAINQAVFDGTCPPTVQVYASDFWAHNSDINDEEWGSYDPDLARQMIVDAGYPDGFSMTIVAPSNFEPLTRLAQVLQAQFGDAGVQVEIMSVEGSQFSPSFWDEGNGDAIMALTLADIEPTITFGQYFTVGGIRNRGDLDNPAAADLISQLRGEPDLAVRSELAGDVMETMLEGGLPLVPLCHRTDFLAHGPNVSGVAIDSLSAPAPIWPQINVED